MSSLKNEAIQGNISTSRDITVGGHLNVHGNSVFDHNVVIKGWLDAKNIKGPCKGLYASLDALKEAYPRPMPGWYALVGNTLPANVYRSDGGKWVATGEQGGEVNLYLDQLEKDVANLDDEVADIEENIENLNANTGVDEYPAFSESKAYAAGDVVNYNGKLYKFTANHTAGVWTGTDAAETDAVKAHIVQELGDSENAVMSQKATTDKFTELEETFSKYLLSNNIDVIKAVEEIYISQEIYDKYKQVVLYNLGKLLSGNIVVQIYGIKTLPANYPRQNAINHFIYCFLTMSCAGPLRQHGESPCEPSAGRGSTANACDTACMNPANPFP